MLDEPDDPNPLTPAFDAGREIPVAVARGAVGAIPALGPILESTVFRAIDLAGRKRDVEFLQHLMARIRRLEDRGMTAQQLADDAAFVAATRRIVRAAEEEASEDKRILLLNALMNAGSWSSLPAVTRTRFLELVIRYSELHVFLLQYFSDPRAWLTAHADGWHEERSPFAAGSVGSVLQRWVFVDDPLWPGEVNRAVGELSADGLLTLNGLNTIGSGSSLYASYTTERALDFIRFVTDNEH